VRTDTLSYTPFNHTYNLRVSISVDSLNCVIRNGSEIIADEIVRFQTWLDSIDSNRRFDAAIDYFLPLGLGHVEQLREYLTSQVKGQFACTAVFYQVAEAEGDDPAHFMDMSGLGNVVFGYYMEEYNVVIEDIISAMEQRLHPRTLFGIFDAPDDLTQRRLGRGVAEELSHAASPSPEFIEVKARQVGLF